MIDIKRTEVLDMIDKIDFFQGRRSGRELWFDKPIEVQEQDCENFARDIRTIRDYILQLEEQPKVGEWIPVFENKPQRQCSDNTIIEFYFVSTKRGNVRLGFRDEDGKWLTEHGNIIPNVIAWMPLPEPYRE